MIDQEQRQLATDPHRSFIVQAPAGSGKTELLTQRFLRLLSQVDAPEQIVALTFTRKAASEMRERILHALNQAAEQVEAKTPHQRLTLDYAKQALQRAQRLNWELLKQPNRLRILTLDALAQTITQAIPIQEQQITFAQISTDPNVYYLKAAKACVYEAINNPELSDLIALLLSHLDNRQDKVLDLFCELLTTRDHWLSALFELREQEKTTFEEALQHIENHELAILKDSLPIGWREPIVRLCRQVSLIENKPEMLRFALSRWQDFHEFNKEIALGLADLLLTKQDALRNSFDHHVGLKKEACSPDIFKQIKAESQELLQGLKEVPHFEEALIRIKNLPEPHYNQQQWAILQVLFTLLPRLVAHLHLTFVNDNITDFTAISQQALQALGNEEAPTDLALYWDHAIHHLLIDEFQDTSLQQFEFISKLIQGWQADEGKTLFIVGDPMQSIYRFRQAEVGLFLRTRQQGIAAIKPTALELKCNFRASAELVHWINQHFQMIFPPYDDVETGAVSFYPATSTKAETAEQAVFAQAFHDKQEEAQAIVETIRQELAANLDQSIAILVRSRSQLKALVAQLRAEQIPFQGVDIEQLANLQVIQDHWILVKALLNPACRISWLALLRSPWCGISLADLHALAVFNPSQPILQTLKDSEKINLSAETLARIHFVYQVIQEALKTRAQEDLVDWLMTTCKQLHQATLFTEQQQQDLERFWNLIETYQEDGLIADTIGFEKKLSELYSQRQTPARLQIMTIHKSKGLEFDVVILPSLSYKKIQIDKPLIRWLKLPTRYKRDLLLVSPVRASHESRCLLYEFLGDLEKEKEAFELQRLLYVAVTRAKKRLYLFDNTIKNSTSTTFRALLTKLEFENKCSEASSSDSENSLPTRLQLPGAYYAITPPSLAPVNPVQPTLSVNNGCARITGIIMHELLQWLCDHHPQSADDLPWYYAEKRLAHYGFEPMKQTQMLHTMRLQMDKFLSDPIGQWLSQRHMDEQNELALLVQTEHQPETRIIDRTFIENDKRWIIDFKTGQDEEKGQDKHRQQVNTYASLLANAEMPVIACGIYYLSSNTWIHWQFALEKAACYDLNNVLLTE